MWLVSSSVQVIGKGIDMDSSKAFGIYMIRNTITGAQYIGMTRKSFDDRWRGHRAALAKGQHASPSLQSDWDQYGEEAFQFSVVEVVENARQVEDRETHWISELNPTYNSALVRRPGRPPKNTLRVELRLNADDAVTQQLEREAEERGTTLQQHITDLLMARHMIGADSWSASPKPQQMTVSSPEDDIQWVREAIAYIARQRGISQSELLFRIAREWLANNAVLDLK